MVDVKGLIAGLLASDNIQAVQLAGTLQTDFELLDAQANLINQNVALTYQQDAISQQRAGLAARRGEITAVKLRQDAANAGRRFGLSREELFLSSGINFRNLANRFGTAGTGDSGFAFRAKSELATGRGLSDKQLRQQFNEAIDNINNQTALNENAMAAGRLDASNAALGSRATRTTLAGQQLDLDSERNDLAETAYGVLTQRGPVKVKSVDPEDREDSKEPGPDTPPPIPIRTGGFR